MRTFYPILAPKKQISGEELTNLMIKSPTFKRLYKHNAKKGLDTINIYMDLVVTPKLREMKNEIYEKTSERLSAEGNDGIALISYFILLD